MSGAGDGIRERIRVRLGNETVETWAWATVRHALRHLDAEVRRRVENGELVVTDGRGHPVGLGGALQDGARLELRAPEDTRR